MMARKSELILLVSSPIAPCGREVNLPHRSAKRWKPRRRSCSSRMHENGEVIVNGPSLR
jgi:hypothetical protein